MIIERNRMPLVAVAMALLLSAGCSSSGSDTSPEPTDAAVEQTSTSVADDPTVTTSTPATTDQTDETTAPASTENAPPPFGTEIPVPEGSTFADDGFAIGSDGPRKAEFELGGDTESALNDYKGTLESAGFVISREQPGRAYVATKGELELQLTAKNDLYDDTIVVLTIIYSTDSA